MWVEGRKEKKKDKWISKENCCYITNTKIQQHCLMPGVKKITEFSEEQSIILNCISCQDWVGWICFRTKTWMYGKWTAETCAVPHSKQGDTVPPGTVCSDKSKLFLYQSNCAIFCSPQDLLASGLVPVKLAVCSLLCVSRGDVLSGASCYVL